MESSDIFAIFAGTKCPVCEEHKSRHTAFCTKCYFQLPRALKSSLWKRFGSGFEEAYHACLSWFREHPWQGEHRARQQNLFEGET
jgi:hypothetical protein